MPFMSASSFFGLGVESTRGTAVAPSYYVPVEAPKWKPDVTWLEDKGMRGSPTELYSEQAGVRHDEYDAKSFAFLDSAPMFLRAILGSTDTVTGSGPYTHTIGQYVSVANGSQPPSYTLIDFDAGAAGATSARQMTSGQLSDLTFEFQSKAALGMTWKWLTSAKTDVAAPTQSYSTEIFVPAWNCAVTLNGTTSLVVEEGSMDIKRNVEAIHTLGQQSAYRLWAAPLVVSGKLTFIAETAVQQPAEPFVVATVILDATTRVTNVLKLVFTEPVSGHNMTLQMSQVQLKMPDPMRDKAYMRIACEYAAEANTTDAVNGGYAPLKSATVNAVSTQY